jgi:hypothetical protein
LGLPFGDAFQSFSLTSDSVLGVPSYFGPDALSYWLPIPSGLPMLGNGSAVFSQPCLNFQALNLIALVRVDKLDMTGMSRSFPSQTRPPTKAPPLLLPPSYISHISFQPCSVPNAGESSPDNAYADPAHHQPVDQAQGCPCWRLLPFPHAVTSSSTQGIAGSKCRHAAPEKTWCSRAKAEESYWLLVGYRVAFVLVELVCHTHGNCPSLGAVKCCFRPVFTALFPY